MDLFRTEDSSLLENLPLFFGQRLGADRLSTIEPLGLAAGELLDLLGDPNAAPVVAAHGAEVGIDVEILVVIRPRGVGIEREIEVLLPVQGGTSLGQLIIVVAGSRNPECDIRGVGGDAICDAPLLDVIPLRKTEMFLGRDVAEHRGSVICRSRRADAGRDVVVSREHVGDQRTKHVERRPVAEATLQFHVEFDLVERHVAGAFDHDLNAATPGSLGEFAEALQFAELSGVGRVGETAGTKTVTDRDNQSISNRLAWLAPTEEAAWVKDAPDDEVIKAAIEERTRIGVTPGSNVIYLMDDEVTSLGADGSAFNIVTMVAHAVNQVGRDRLTKMRIRGGRHRIMNAYAVGPNGDRVEASSIRGKQVRFRKLEVGSTVVLQYRVDERPDGYLSGYAARAWWFQGGGVHTHRARWVLYMAADTQLNESVVGPVQRKQSQVGEQKRVEWSATSQPPIIREPGMPGLSEIAAHVSMSTVPSWETFWKWEQALLVDVFRESPDLVELAKTLFEGTQDNAEKVRRIHTYLMTKIRYQQDYEGTIAGVKPHAAPQVVARQYGDCKDKAVLFITLARLGGVEVHFALVRTRTAGPVRKAVPMQQFNHAIVYVPAQPGIAAGRFYDPTVDALDVEILRHDDQGTLSVVYDPVQGTHEWREIPYQSAATDETVSELVGDIDAEGALR